MRVTKSGRFIKSYSALTAKDWVPVLSVLAKLEKAPMPICKSLRPPLEKCKSLRTGHRGQQRIVYFLETDRALLLIVGERKNLEVYSDAAQVLRELGL
jgi:mRNA-degrading endonuclease RelE of RelBE toxin-antitoxin system